MRTKQLLTDNEYQIMELLWASDTPLSKKGIVDQISDKSWKESSIFILINSLLKKGMIEIAGFVQTQTNYGRTFTPTISKKDYTIKSLDESRKRADLSLPELMCGMIDRETDPEMIKVLEEMIKNKLESLGK